MIYAKTELIEFPRNCFECPYGRKGKCCITNKAMTRTKRNRFCPLVADWIVTMKMICE